MTEPNMYREIGPKGRGKRFFKSVEACKKRVRDDEDYFIRRHGGWFRPNAQGYTCDIAEAGLFPGVEARKYLDVDGLVVVPLASARDFIWRQSRDAVARAAKLSSLATR